MQQETIGQSNDAATYAPLTPVPPERRAFGTSDAFALWFSLGIGLLVAQAGALLVPGLSLPHALVAIAIGTVLGVVLLALAGVVGTDTGLAAMSSLRPTLGVRGVRCRPCSTRFSSSAGARSKSS